MAYSLVVPASPPNSSDFPTFSLLSLPCSCHSTPLVRCPHLVNLSYFHLYFTQFLCLDGVTSLLSRLPSSLELKSELFHFTNSLPPPSVLTALWWLLQPILYIPWIFSVFSLNSSLSFSSSWRLLSFFLSSDFFPLFSSAFCLLLLAFRFLLYLLFLFKNPPTYYFL